MNNEMKIREEVYNKMEKEYNGFIENIKTKTPEEIIESSYEKVMKYEILCDFEPEFRHYDIERIKSLNKSNDPLEEIYQGWMDWDGGLHNAIEDSIENTLDKLVKEQKEKKKTRER